MNRPLRVGLTGGVASGKSTVSQAFARRGVPTFSADEISHELTEPGAPALARIRASFGDGVFTPGGALDRAALAEQIFADAEARERLEGILHPPIASELAALTSACDAPYCVVEIPLLEPRHVGELVDRVLVVDVSAENQLRRLQTRNGLTRAAAQSRIVAQKSREARLAMADDVIRNDGLPAEIDAQVEALHVLYTDLARRGEWAP
ncbi:MAG: dephospho-CoA kinase [Gammaproteobacteria bacterium]